MATSNSPENDLATCVLPVAKAALREATRPGTHGDLGNVYVGSAGAALALYKIGEWAKSDAKVSAEFGEARKLLEQAIEMAEESKKAPRMKRKPTMLAGLPGPHAIRAMALNSLGRSDEALSEVRSLLDWKGAAMTVGGGECELMSGKAGYLSSLLHIRASLGSHAIENSHITEMTERIVDEGSEMAQEGFPDWSLMYEWHGKQYLGACHGIVGILYTLLVAERMGIGLSERARSRLGECLRRLVQEQFQDGNLPSSLSSRHRNRLVQWCHGAAGFASLLSLASRCGIQCEGIESALEACGECLIARGFARGKGIGVCHGIAGNGYGLLDVYKATGRERYLRAAQEMAMVCAREYGDLKSVNDRPNSLFEGVAGGATFMVDALFPDSATFPAFEPMP